MLFYVVFACCSFNFGHILAIPNPSFLINYYFKFVKPVHEIAVYDSNESGASHEILTILTKNDFTVQLNSTKSNNAPLGIYLHLNSLEMHDVLHRSTFNLSYFWLIQGNKSEMLDSIFQINIDSQITFAENSGELVDVFSFGRHLKRELIRNVIGTWTESSVNLSTKMGPLYRKNYRGNLQQTTLRQGVYVSTHFFLFSFFSAFFFHFFLLYFRF